MEIGTILISPVRRELARSGIFCPVRWPLVGGEGVPLSPPIDKQESPFSWEISRSIMMVFCDPRYAKKEMGYILDRVDKLKA